MHDSAEAMAQRSLRRKRNQSIERVALGVACPLVLLAIWQMLDLTGIIDQRFFPPPTRVFANAVGILADTEQRGQLLADLVVTLRRLAFGYVLGAASGVAMGMAMACTRRCVSRSAQWFTVHSQCPRSPSFLC